MISERYIYYVLTQVSTFKGQKVDIHVKFH